MREVSLYSAGWDEISADAEFRIHGEQGQHLEGSYLGLMDCCIAQL